MNALTVISTDLLTPLGAYLRLRESRRASFLLESVERGRLGRHSFVGSGSRLVDLAEAEQLALAVPVVGYLGYDHAATLEPTVQLPDAGRGLPESRFVVAETLVRFDHGLGMAEVLAGDPLEVADLLEGPLPETKRGGDRLAGSTRRLPSRHQYERAVVKAKEHIRAGDAFQIVLSQRAERPTSASALDIYRSLRRVNPSPYLFLLELDGLALVGSSPETLVKAEGRAASLNPIAGTTRRGARALPPRPVRGRGPLRAAGRGARRVHCNSNHCLDGRGRAPPGRRGDRRRLRPGGRARRVPAQAGRA